MSVSASFCAVRLRLESVLVFSAFRPPLVSLRSLQLQISPLSARTALSDPLHSHPSPLCPIHISLPLPSPSPPIPPVSSSHFFQTRLEYTRVGGSFNSFAFLRSGESCLLRCPAALLTNTIFRDSTGAGEPGLAVSSVCAVSAVLISLAVASALSADRSVEWRCRLGSIPTLSDYAPHPSTTPKSGCWSTHSHPQLADVIEGSVGLGLASSRVLPHFLHLRSACSVHFRRRPSFEDTRGCGCQHAPPAASAPLRAHSPSPLTPLSRSPPLKHSSLVSHIESVSLNILYNCVLQAASTTRDGLDPRYHKTIQKQFTEFTSAYDSFPDEIKSKVQSRYHQYTSWWSNHQLDNLDSERFREIHNKLQKVLKLQETKATKDMNSWENEKQKIFRNLLISIDSSIIPLRQTEILNFEEETEHAKPMNKANYMYKSVPTSHGKNNFIKSPIDLFFRPSTYSLFSHIFFNSNGYAKTCALRDTDTSIFHVVTGTPGIGKSSIRMPLISLAMSLGANKVKTARHGEPSFIFENQNEINYDTEQILCDYDEQSCQDSPLDPIGNASVTINRKHRPTVTISRDAFCYTYDVTMYAPTSKNEIYDPTQVYSSPQYLGELKVPSIHHFPHFFKLFVNKDNQVENRLQGTTWHIVDDFVLRSSNIDPHSHVVLLTSPAKKRWIDITEYKAQHDPVLLYNVPTLLYPEMIHMFNAIPCPYEYNVNPTSRMMEAQNSIREQGMIPQDVLTSCVLNCEYRFIHPSSPQFDPVNWFTQLATQDSVRMVEDRTTRKKCESTKLNLISRYNQHLRAAGFDKDHSEGHLSAVEEGLTLTQLRPMEPIGRHTHRQAPVSFPKTDFSLCEKMSYSWNIPTITVPEITSFNRHAGEAYDPQWDFLFQHCVDKEALACFSHPSNADEMSDADEDFVSGGRRAHWARMQIVTGHLIPNHVPNGAFDSVVVIFRLVKESDELHTLGIVFLKGTTDSKPDISDESVRLMKKWCFILKTLYNLKRVQIFPSFLVVTDSNGRSRFSPNSMQKLRSFIPEQNRWVSQFEAKDDIEVGNVRIRPMTASAAPVLARFVDLEVNHNPHMVRCAFCGSLVAVNFPNHYCEAVRDHKPTIPQNPNLIDALDRSNKTEPESVEEHIQMEQLNQHGFSFTQTEIEFVEERPKRGKQKEKQSKDTKRKRGGKQEDQSKATTLDAEEMQEDQSTEIHTVTIYVDFVSTKSHIQQKKVNSGLWPRIQSSSSQSAFVQVTCSSEIPGTPDFYRLPSRSQIPEVEGAALPLNQSQSKDALREPSHVVRPGASTQSLGQCLNDSSTIMEAHRLWCGGSKLGFTNDGNWRYRPIKLGKQPFQSLEFDVPTVNFTDPTLETQYMLPAGANASLGRITVCSEQGRDYIQTKRIEYESFWQSLNRKTPPPTLASTLQSDTNTLIKKIQRCGNETENCQLECILAKGLLLQSRLSLQSGNLKDAISFFGQSKEHMELNDTAEVEYELMETMQDCENEVMRSHPTCLEAIKLLQRSRLCLQSEDLEMAIFLFEKSKEHMEMNGTADVESALKRVVENALNCFRMDWRQWIPERPSLPILLSPSFDMLRSHLQRVEEHVATLGSLLERSEVEIPMTDESRRRMAKDPILQALKEGLSLQLLIAWRTGSRDQVIFFQNELSALSKFDGSVDQQQMSTPFKSEEEQIVELDIGVMTKAIEDILNTTRTRCGQWRTLVRQHQQALSSARQPSGNLEGDGSANKLKMMIGRNVSVSGVLPIDPNMPNEIRMNAQLNIDRISAIIVVCHPKLKETGHNEVINDLYQMMSDMTSIVTKTSNLTQNVKNLEFESSDFMMIDDPKEKPSLSEEHNTTLYEKDTGKQKRGDSTDSGLYGAPFKPDKRMQISSLQQFRDAWPGFDVCEVDSDGNCGLQAIQASLTQEELAMWERNHPHFNEVGIDSRWISQSDLTTLAFLIGRPIACHYQTCGMNTYGIDHDGATIHIGLLNNSHYVAMRKKQN
ncbi:hypothetical protein BLNAU_17596 [Blattamonas nauphoetae]|uniref:OTU domain-containing protein n=1 Tax=Blattamonas nauphoetae TaxID=2049346 RepID=A0ABQ9X6P1_9EUKA|nr:hypothetical protein BLNAU_17596 [Blattamonas nauphoetae]